MNDFKTLSPGWRQVPHIKAFTILARSADGSGATFAGESETAMLSKQNLSGFTGIKELHWLNQVHEDTVLELPQTDNKADAVVTSHPGVICAVRTADCLPVLFTTLNGKRIAAAHAGWRGLQKGILLKTIESLHEKPENILAWIGPAIAQKSYETGVEVYEAFTLPDPGISSFFKPGDHNKYFADLAGIARYQMERFGLLPEHISGGIWDTFTDDDLHSYRRDGKDSGRMLSLVWME